MNTALLRPSTLSAEKITARCAEHLDITSEHSWRAVIVDAYDCRACMLLSQVSTSDSLNDVLENEICFFLVAEYDLEFCKEISHEVAGTYV